MPKPAHRKIKFALTSDSLKETIDSLSNSNEVRSTLESIYKANDGYLKIYRNGICIETEIIGGKTKLHSILSTNRNLLTNKNIHE